MILASAYSINQIPILLTDKRWENITLGHPEVIPYFEQVIATIEFPELVFRGTHATLMGVSQLTDKQQFLVVMYQEDTQEHGWITTAYLTQTIHALFNKPKLWPTP